MSKNNSFRAFITFLGLSELIFNDNKATVTMDQVTEANDRLNEVQAQNEDLRTQNTQLAAELAKQKTEAETLNAALAAANSENASLKTENETLKNQAGAKPATVITSNDPAPLNNTETPVTSKDKSFMENLEAFEKAYSNYF